MRAVLAPSIIYIAVLTGCTGSLGSAGEGTPSAGSGASDSDTGGAGTTVPGAGGSSSNGGSSSGAGTGGDVGTSSGGASAQTGGAATMPPPTNDQGRYVCNDKTYGSVAQGRRLTAAEYANAITDVFGVTPSTLYPGSYGQSATGYSTEPGINTIGEQGVEKLMNAAEEVAEALPARLAKILPCTTKADDACAQTYLSTVGRRAFRRALSADEQTGLLAVYKAEKADGATFPEAVSVMTAQMLQMPGFVYAMEQPSAAGVDRALSGVELATRLSLQLWGSVPDDTLLDLAETGKLTGKDAVLVQAKRLFADARADRGFVRFFREWTQTDPLTVTSKDLAAFPYFNLAFATSVNESFNRFVTDQVRSSKTLYDVLRSNTMFVDANVATLLGMTGVSTWTSVTVPADRYSGIMSQPAMLAALAHSSDTSYVFRGRFVRKRLLCQGIGAPPADAMTKFAALPKPTDPTARDLASVIEAQPVCGGCHTLLDPAGLAFEHFDAMGAYREQYKSGKAIDTAGSLLGVTATTMSFDGPVDMMEALADLDQTKQCFATQIFRYTASKMEGGGDLCAIQQIQDAMAAADGQVQEAFLASTQTDAFLYRRGE